MVNTLSILYIAILISTHESAVESLTSVVVLLLHDFTQNAIITSHKYDSIVTSALQSRMLLSAFVGVQLLLLNLFITYLVFFSPGIYLFQQVLAEWPGHGIQVENGTALVLRSLRKIYEYGSLHGGEIAIGFLSVIPGSLVQTGAYWLAAVTYGNMCVRRALHGSRLENLCFDDVLANGLATAVALLTGQRIVRMVESLASKILFEGAVDTYDGGSIGYSNRRDVVGGLMMVWTSVLDVLISVCCQAIMCIGIAKRDVFGRQCETRRTLIKVWMIEVLFGVLRVGNLVDWGSSIVSIGCGISTVAVVMAVAKYARGEYVILKYVEERRERALCR